ncbi:hypothetical protein AB0M58_38845 [Streptomyces bobili]|uniref:hypothetical protein n=1 Tax=Streptomyces bobili TaxID=67280 RepID=UPI0034123038
MPDAEQLYAVIGVGIGVEVVALSVLEQRCAAGWQGVILAGASDLPEALLETRLQAMSVGEPEGASVSARVYDPHDEAFGRSLSAAEGERVLVRLCEGRDVGQALRSLALARSVPDLRDLEAGGYDDRGHPRRPFTPDAWNGLLAMEQLDLEPLNLLGNKEFEPCSKCGGYAVRRLTDPQVAYYRASVPRAA